MNIFYILLSCIMKYGAICTASQRPPYFLQRHHRADSAHFSCDTSIFSLSITKDIQVIFPVYLFFHSFSFFGSATVFSLSAFSIFIIKLIHFTNIAPSVYNDATKQEEKKLTNLTKPPHKNDEKENGYV